MEKCYYCDSKMRPEDACVKSVCMGIGESGLLVDSDKRVCRFCNTLDDCGSASFQIGFANRRLSRMFNVLLSATREIT